MATLTVMTWNVQNLLDLPPDADDAERAAREAKLAQLAAIVDDVAPHVLALQEVGSAAVLAALNEHLAVDFDNRIVGEPDDRGIRVALLSPRRLSNVQHARVFPGALAPIQVADPGADDPDTDADESVTRRTGRGILSATLWSGGRRVTVATCHLKSKLISYPPLRHGGETRFWPRDEGERHRYAGYAVMRRSAEAMTCRALLDRELTVEGDEVGRGDGAGRERPVILLGDLNDEPEAATTQILLGPGGSQIDFRPGSGFQRGDRGDGFRMWNLAPLLPSDGPSGTRVYRGRAELIDHILASQTLVNPDKIPQFEIVPATPLPSVGDDPTSAATTAAPSDHAAVVATFDV